MERKEFCEFMGIKGDLVFRFHVFQLYGNFREKGNFFGIVLYCGIVRWVVVGCLFFFFFVIYC